MFKNFNVIILKTKNCFKICGINATLWLVCVIS